MSARTWSPRRGVVRSRAVLVGLVVALLTLCTAPAASAFWTVTVVTGSGASALAWAASLTPPSGASAVQASATSVDVSWSVPTSQLAGARYTVTRTTGGGAGTVVCTAVSTTSCTDTGLLAGSSYGWSVVAVIGLNWRSTAATASATLLGVTTTSLAGGNVGSAYSQTLSATGGTGGGTYTWTLTAGTLPAGLTLASNGVLSGTPTAGGTTSGLQFTVTDGAGRTATSGSLSITIGKNTQTITVTNAITTAAAGTTWTPAVTASSGLTVTISVDPSTSTNCSVTAGVVTFLRLSSCKVNFNQAGDAAFEAAPQVQTTITVTRGTQTITFTAPTEAGIGGPTPLGATASSGLPVSLSSSTTAVCTVSGVNVTYVAAGTCTITASQAGNADFFEATSVTRSFTVYAQAGLGVVIVGGTGNPVLACTGSTVTATRSCTVSGVDLSGSATINVVVLSSAGNRVVYSYTAAGAVNQTGQDIGTATIPIGTSSTSATLTASHVGNAPKTSTITLGSFTLNLTVVT